MQWGSQNIALRLPSETFTTYMFTAHKSSHGKVMFLGACVKNYLHRDGVSTLGDVCRGDVNKRAVRILLECTLVSLVCQET